MELTTLVQEVVKIAKVAGEIILDVYENADSFQVEAKSDASPLTIADKKANAHICNELVKLPVDYPIISEENKAIAYQVRKDFTRFWLVDPLDGTKEFIKRNGEFTVNIALIENGQPIMGVVYAPVLDEMYWATQGNGAFWTKNGEELPLEAASFTLADSQLQVVCSRSHLNEATQKFVDQLDQPQLVPTGSSLKFLIIAKGEAHVYPRLGPTMEWDTGAAHMILQEAGGKVEKADDNQPLEYNKEDLLNPYFVAYGNVQA
ncbi:MAG: 3'(2'),5'-bisphosphate nucleotidase CysQ [Bacteroidota bacterium]